MYLP
jgi:hypothetical protein